MSVFVRLVLSLVVILAYPQYSQAQEIDTLSKHLGHKVERGVRKGTVIPHNLEGVDQYERAVNLDKLSGSNGIVLYFVRSAIWCQYCVQQLEDISRRGSSIEDTGYNIVIVSHDSVKQLARFTRKYHFPYPMISDPESEIIKAFGLFNNAYKKGTSYYGIAHPATYVVGYDGLIIDKFFDNDFKERLFVKDVRRWIDSIGDYESVLPEEQSIQNIVQ